MRARRRSMLGSGWGGLTALVALTWLWSSQISWSGDVPEPTEVPRRRERDADAPADVIPAFAGHAIRRPRLGPAPRAAARRRGGLPARVRGARARGRGDRLLGSRGLGPRRRRARRVGAARARLRAVRERRDPGRPADGRRPAGRRPARHAARLGRSARRACLRDREPAARPRDAVLGRRPSPCS